ncbi:MAG: hypothetical protein MZU97_01080 [Bacillus subtilis]|nr:hypothetical protein [Bacillus subtilis]
MNCGLCPSINWQRRSRRVHGHIRRMARKRPRSGRPRSDDANRRRLYPMEIRRGSQLAKPRRLDDVDWTRGSKRHGQDPSPTFRVSGGKLQWQYSGEATWKDLLDLAVITGEDGADGREIELRVDSGFLQSAL